MRKAEATIAKVSEDISERFSFHTAISAVQELVNLATKGVGEGLYASERATAALRYSAQTAVSLLFPFAPHVASELWEALGRRAACGASRGPWPTRRSSTRETATIVVQVNGKLRDRLEVAVGTDDADVLAAARELPKVASALEGKSVVREVVVPGRLVNFVVK